MSDRMSKGDMLAKTRLIQSNLRLVVNRAKNFTRNDIGLTIDDLVQEGNIGLMRAIDRFDATRGYKFSTYAGWWINQAILRAIANKGKIVRDKTLFFIRSSFEINTSQPGSRLDRMFFMGEFNLRPRPAKRTDR